MIPYYIEASGNDYIIHLGTDEWVPRLVRGISNTGGGLRASIASLGLLTPAFDRLVIGAFVEGVGEVNVLISDPDNSLISSSTNDVALIDVFIPTDKMPLLDIPDDCFIHITGKAGVASTPRYMAVPIVCRDLTSLGWVMHQGRPYKRSISTYRYIMEAKEARTALRGNYDYNNNIILPPLSGVGRVNVSGVGQIYVQGYDAWVLGQDQNNWGNPYISWLDNRNLNNGVSPLGTEVTQTGSFSSLFSTLTFGGYDSIKLAGHSGPETVTIVPTGLGVFSNADYTNDGVTEVVTVTMPFSFSGVVGQNDSVERDLSSAGSFSSGSRGVTSTGRYTLAEPEYRGATISADISVSSEGEEVLYYFGAGEEDFIYETVYNGTTYQADMVITSSFEESNPWVRRPRPPLYMCSDKGRIFLGGRIQT